MIIKIIIFFTSALEMYILFILYIDLIVVIVPIAVLNVQYPAKCVLSLNWFVCKILHRYMGPEFVLNVLSNCQSCLQRQSCVLAIMNQIMYVTAAQKWTAYYQIYINDIRKYILYACNAWWYKGFSHANEHFVHQLGAKTWQIRYTISCLKVAESAASSS